MPAAVAILGSMHLVAVVSGDPDIRHALSSFRDAQARFHLQPVAGGAVDGLFRGLERLDFAGALILDPDAQGDALRLASRSSLDAEEVGGADTVTVTPGGVIAEYNLGRAAAALLAASRWDAKGAEVVLLGGSQAARGVARELSSLGAASVALLAGSPADAERALPELAAGTGVVARSANDPLVPTLLERADLLVRLDAGVPVPASLLGPHLTLLDLVGEPVSALRRRAMSVGALTFNRFDVDAYLIELGLTHILGAPVGVEPLLELFHSL
jgi:shikimate 5-dehydrogenase